MTGPSSPPVRIAVVGAGGVGGYFAGVLALAGQDVHLLARGKHLDAIHARGGLQIVQPGGVRDTAHVGATSDPAALAGSAFVIVAVKSYSLDEIAPVLRALAAQGSVIAPLLNGVGIDDRLAALGIPRTSIAGGLTVHCRRPHRTRCDRTIEPVRAHYPRRVPRPDVRSPGSARGRPSPCGCRGDRNPRH